MISLLLLLIVIFLNLPAEYIVGARRAGRDGIAPFQNVMSFFINGIGRGFSKIAGLKGDVEERKQMQEEIATLRFQVRNLKSLEYENEELRSNLDFVQKQKKKLILCEVMVRMDSSGWWQSIRLNRGFAKF